MPCFSRPISRSTPKRCILGTIPALTLAVLIMAVSPATASGKAEKPSSRKVPRRIISLGPINTENVFLLGAGNRLIADTIYCVRPEAARHREKVGSLMEINIEKIIALRPDLVLATGLTRPEQVRKLKSVGLRVVRFPKPDSFQAICRQFIRLGTILCMEQRAEQVVAQARNQVRCVEGVVAGLPPRRVFLQVGADPVFASVPGSFTNDYIRFGGGINIASGQSTGLFSTEKVVSLNPDVILIAVMGSESGIAAREKRRWMSFQSMNAARTGRVYTLDPDMICSPSPLTFASALKKIAGLIHPEAVRIIEERCSKANMN